MRRPRAGDRVEDLMFEGGLGTVTGTAWVQDSLYYTVRFDKPKFAEDGTRYEDDQIEESFFNGPDENCGTCRYDEERQLFVIDKDPDALPPDHPDAIAINQMFERMNEELAAKRERNPWA